MPRLNLTLDADTFARLDRHAKRQGAPRAGVARRILREALEAREALERKKKLAADYTAGRKDARALLEDLEVPQLEWFDRGLGAVRAPRPGIDPPRSGQKA